MSRVVWLFVIVVAVACGKGKQDKAAEGSQAAGSGSAGSGSTAAGSGTGSAAVDPAVVELVKKSGCDEPCLFLTTTPFDQFEAAHAKACPGSKVAWLVTDECEKLDYLRNCIFAAHGFKFQKKKWQDIFATRPWYKINEDFKANMLPAAERATVTDLNDRGKACKQGIKITAADLKRVKAWLAPMPKAAPAEIPKHMFVNGEPVKKFDKVLAAIKDELDPPQPTHDAVTMEEALKKATADYVTPDSIAEPLAKALGTPPDPKLRIINLMIETSVNANEEMTIIEGLALILVYDGNDKLVLVNAEHFLWD